MGENDKTGMGSNQHNSIEMCRFGHSESLESDLRWSKQREKRTEHASGTVTGTISHSSRIVVPVLNNTLLGRAPHRRLLLICLVIVIYNHLEVSNSMVDEVNAAPLVRTAGHHAP